MKIKRYLGVDYGDVRTGIAVSDPLGITASGVGTIKAEGKRTLASAINKYVTEYGVEEIVMGYPINMNGTKGDRAQKAEDFAEYLSEVTGKHVELFDERCTTMAAHQILNYTDTRGKKRKNVIDTLSAQIILQNYMDMHRNDSE